MSELDHVRDEKKKIMEDNATAEREAQEEFNLIENKLFTGCGGNFLQKTKSFNSSCLFRKIEF